MSIAGMKLSGMLSAGLETVYEYRKHNEIPGESRIFPGVLLTFQIFYVKLIINNSSGIPPMSSFHIFYVLADSALNFRHNFANESKEKW